LGTKRETRADENRRIAVNKIGAVGEESIK
jgi:hypothetical protein